MFDFIQVTAQYSNAVLVALLPYFSEFTRTQELPVPTPIAMAHVEKFVCGIHKSDVGGYLVLTNGLELWFDHGRVRAFRTPRSYFSLQDPADIPAFFGPLRMNETEALQLARERIRKLGYSRDETFIDQKPEVTSPPRVGTNVVPHYRFTWYEPLYGVTAVRVEVDAANRTIQEMQLMSPFTWRDPPRIDIRPEVLRAGPPVTLESSKAFLETFLPKISDFSKALNLPVERPASREQVLHVEFIDVETDVRVKLTNGWWFLCDKRSVNGFSAPSSVYGRQPVDKPKPIKEYLGKWRMTEDQTIELARQTIRKAGFREADFQTDNKPELLTPKPVGEYVVPRYFVRWVVRHPPNPSIVIAEAAVEVDADAGVIKHLSLFSAYRNRDLGDSEKAASGKGTPP